MKVLEETQKEQQKQEIEQEDLQDTSSENEVHKDLEKEEVPVDEVAAEIEKLKLEKLEALNRFQRLQADFENARKRNIKERSELINSANANLVLSLLPVLDNFQRALNSEESSKFKEGIDLILKQFTEILEREGLQEIYCANKEFDPNFHDAVMQVHEENLPENTVVEVVQKGYTFKEKVIRAAMVKVNS